MIGSDSMNSEGTAADAGGWELLADHDGAVALVGAVIRLDPDESYTKTELSDEAGVAYKSLYLSGTVEALVDVGLLEREDREGDEPAFRVDSDAAVYEAASAFDDAACQQVESP